MSTWRWTLGSLLLLLVAVLNAGASSAQFFHTDGHDILDPQGQVFRAKGINLNGWLVPEAYSMRLNAVHKRHLNGKSDIERNIRNLLQNDDDAADFWDAYINNYVTEQDITDLADMGFNAIRLPFNFRLVSPVDTPGEYSEEGFQLLDKVIGWCRGAGLALLLDMHSCPGGQSHESHADPEYSYWHADDNSTEYYERGVQVLWENNEDYFQATGRTPESNKDRTAEVWRTIAERYKDEPSLLGYEIANEPYYHTSAGVTDNDLRQFFIQVTAAIREVDSNHIVVVEGNIFAEEIGGLLPPFDDNMVVAFHRYWRETGYADGVVQQYLDSREEYNIPFLMTESGENSDPWVYEMRELMETNNIGWFYWGFKKVYGIALHYEISVSDDYQYVIDNWRDSQPDPARIKQGLMDLAEASKSENCRIQPGYLAAMLDPEFATVPKPYAEVSLPGTVYAAHYDVGNQGIAYHDVRYKNEEYLGTGWNLGWHYRNDGVDVAVTTDDFAERSIGYHVFSMETGEWIKYTVNVVTPGIYSVRSRARNTNGTDGYFALAVSKDKNKPPSILNGTEPMLFVDVPASQTAWAYIAQESTMYFPAGEQVVTLTVMEGGMELAWMDFVFVRREDRGSGSCNPPNTSVLWTLMAGLFLASILFKIL